MALEIYSDGTEMEVYFAVPSPIGVLPADHRIEAVPLVVADPEDACSPLRSKHLAGEATSWTYGHLNKEGICGVTPLLPACTPYGACTRHADPSRILSTCRTCNMMLYACAGAAVLVKRGGCTFSEKAQAVDVARGAALIVYNNEEGQSGRPGLFLRLSASHAALAHA